VTHCAISDNHLDMIKLHVAKGGRTTVLDEQGQTPIQRARAAKQYAAKILGKNGVEEAVNEMLVYR
jgi:hypothetical protein